MIMLPLDLRISIENAWIEIEEIFDKVSEGINDIKISDFQKVGLSSAELDFKISIFNLLHYNFRKNTFTRSF